MGAPTDPDQGNYRVVREGVTIELNSNERAQLVFRGVMTEKDPRDWFLPLLQRAAACTLEGGYRVVLDFRELEYMNAAAFRVLVAWLKVVRKWEPPVRVRIDGDKRHSWQRVAIHAINIFTVDDLESE